MKQVQLSGTALKTVRDALKGDDSVVVFDGEVPVARLVSIDAEMRRRGDFFTFYPHDPAECFGTCWRHDGHATETEQVPEDEPVPAGA